MSELSPSQNTMPWACKPEGLALSKTVIGDLDNRNPLRNRITTSVGKSSIYVRWAETPRSTSVNELFNLRNKLESHLSQLALCGIAVVPRSYFIANHPNSSDPTLYITTPEISGKSIADLQDRLETSAMAATECHGIAEKLKSYREWCVRQGQIMYDVASPAQYVNGMLPNDKEPATYLVDIEPAFASFDGSSPQDLHYLPLFDTQVAGLSQARSLTEESEHYTNIIADILRDPFGHN